MMLIDIRALSRGPLETVVDVPIDDPALTDIEFTLARPVAVRGRLMDSGPGRYFWDAELVTQVAGSCRRCLTPVTQPVRVRVQALFTEDVGTDDPAAYPLPPHATEIDLGQAVREELILAVPQYVECREGCRGICPGCGTDLNTGVCRCRPEPDPRWAALDALRGTRPDDER